MKLKGENGFSLVELILVITIFSTFVLLAFPYMRISGSLISGDTQKVYTAMRKIRQLAITESTDYLVEILPDNRLGIRKEGNLNFLEVIEIHDSLTLNCTRVANQIRFTPLGTAVSGSFIISDGINSKRVVIAGNGRIRVD